MTIKFCFILVSYSTQKIVAQLCFSLLLRTLSMLMLLILLCGDVQRNPGPLSICYWNLGGLPTQNFYKKTLLEVFLSSNDFDILILGESHLNSKVDENDLNIDGYSFKRCDNSADIGRGGVILYHKTSLPCVFKPELTNLHETLVLQVKVGSKK